MYLLLLNIDVLQALCLKDTSEYVNPFIKINKDEFWLARNGGRGFINMVSEAPTLLL